MIYLSRFFLTVKQLEKIIRDAKSDENQEDILSFEVKNGRLIITQNDWEHDQVSTLMNKPC